MNKQFLMVRSADGLILGTILLEDPDAGPTIPADQPPAGMAFVAYDEPFTRSGRADTESAYLVDGAVEWRDTAALAALQVQALADVDAAGEAMRLAVINHMPTQTEEYRQALQQASAWRSAGYPESEESPAPPDVTSWAMAKWRDGWTSRQAADDILATADHWAAIISKIRLLRLVSKEDVRHAATSAAVRSIVADMRADMRSLAQQLNLTLTE